ncbi:MAG: hypothetical protein A3H52_02760 [Candidatus Zambryskibacteria bacterium RIFCSPLOWO2_02_FULL_39_26]|uniref:Uncharacterized protein n=1 Tax=Candidatus Zambryskibacteria bacterium RIFCSPLOWO2_12_FULL_39_23 TaxID=1802776 RepID=A0A1G2UQR8_9BACT|nr:MAG: hypothetical protein A2W51_02315 [Candidatus Zambryskibacteria bacterium RIFCSPHIGHO2_02_39_10]OHA99383.1 MAG: hypothetical protein A3E59_00480 [Candidatus Zambryskibacteria bacterium RIFCSPHIGHO2_12_FULL_39_47]OHB10373.1 MAG: hypothetical protein A3H52_02760 [Candidatus Zambryskibacteria bacterium RIFCSPLOWO2_02_FULL_39_26]OHB11728.1 MAG: hypothetical protein A3G99_03135 [Candidatus Zambryskibacteria bacterium RIFCSPLOWO2_12_FULL_39_23]
MEALLILTTTTITLITLKAIIGFRFPWEPTMKAKRSLQRNLEMIKGSIPSEIYNEMQYAIERI